MICQAFSEAKQIKMVLSKNKHAGKAKSSPDKSEELLIYRE